VALTVFLAVHYATAWRPADDPDLGALPGWPVANGQPLSQIYPVGTDGSAVPVALYDQDGHPIEIDGGFPGLACPADAAELAIPYQDAGGRIMSNVYPLRSVCVDASGVVVAPESRAPGAPAIAWAATAAPSLGQRVALDATGAYAGVVAPSDETSPSPTAIPQPGR
jgi:hypothetical protein